MPGLSSSVSMQAIYIASLCVLLEMAQNPKYLTTKNKGKYVIPSWHFEIESTQQIPKGANFEAKTTRGLRPRQRMHDGSFLRQQVVVFPEVDHAPAKRKPDRARATSEEVQHGAVTYTTLARNTSFLFRAAGNTSAARTQSSPSDDDGYVTTDRPSSWVAREQAAGPIIL